MTKHTQANPDVDVFAKVMARLICTGLALLVAGAWIALWHFNAVFWLFFSQLAVVPVWAVLGPRSFVARCVTAYLFAPITMVYLVQAVLLPKHERIVPGELLVVMFSLVLFPATLRVLGYACTFSNAHSGRDQTHFQFSIREILGLTALVAVSVVIAKANGGESLWAESWLILLLLPGLAAWAIFSLPAPIAAVVILGVTLLTASSELFIRDQPSVIMYMIGVTSPLVVLRSLGFRLRKVQARSKPTSSTEASFNSSQDHA